MTPETIGARRHKQQETDIVGKKKMTAEELEEKRLDAEQAILRQMQRKNKLHGNYAQEAFRPVRGR